MVLIRTGMYRSKVQARPGLVPVELVMNPTAFFRAALTQTQLQRCDKIQTNCTESHVFFICQHAFTQSVQLFGFNTQKTNAPIDPPITGGPTTNSTENTFQQ